MKKNKVSDDDIALFRQAVSGARRIVSDRIEPERKLPARHPPSNRLTTASRNEVDVWESVPENELQTADTLNYARSGVQRRTMRALRRGQLGPKTELDLHGMRITEARVALIRFLDQCHTRKARTVLVIHGKGLGSETRQPVLKQKVNQWLRQRRDVLAFCSATPRDGGTGAVYVLLQNPRKIRSRL